MRARDNPFRTECLSRVRYRLQGITWPGLLARCEALNYRGALVGPYGSGKTTLLEDLAPRMQKQGFRPLLIRLDADHPKLQRRLMSQLVPELSSRAIVLFDGVDRLNTLGWAWFKWRTRRASGLIITAHRPGLLQTLWECHTSAALLETIIADLLGSEPGTYAGRVEDAFQRHDGNLREALREFYDRAAEPAPRFRLETLLMA